MSKVQVSLVIEIEENVDELEVIRQIKIFLKSMKIVDIVGIHTKLVKEYGNKPY